MQSIRIAREELASLIRRPIAVAALVVISLIPLLYGGLYLWAFWDPYGSLSGVPVAVVNEDVAARSGDTTIDAGGDLVAELKKSHALGWRFVGRTEAQAGLRANRYYMTLTIPRDFSASLASAAGARPRRASLTVTSHESSNMLASQIGSRVFAEVRAAAAASASRRYFDTVFVGFADSRGKLGEAALAARDLASGLKEARDGSARLASGLEDAHAGAHELASGNAALASGAGKVSSGAASLASGASRLSNGVTAAGEGARSLEGAAHRLSSGASSLADGTRSLADGASAAAKGAASVREGAARLSAGIDEAVPSLRSAADGAGGVRDGSDAVVQALQAYAQAHPEAASDKTFATALGASRQTHEGAAQLAAGLSEAGSKLTPLAEGAHSLASGSAKLADGIAALDEGAKGAAAGASTLAEGARKTARGTASLSSGLGGAASGADALASGARSVASGASAVSSGSHAAAAGSAALVSGLARLDDGAHSLADGLAPAVSGSSELASGLTAGLRDMPAYDTKERAQHAAMMSDPVQLRESRLGEVRNYGTGFAPYFIPVALWVGAVMVFFLVNPLPARAVRERRLGIVAALGSYWQAALVALAQTAALLLALRYGLGLQPRSVPALCLAALLASLASVAILQWLSGAFGIAGRFFGIVLLVLQLTSSAGTFPLQTVPPFFRAISPLLPMTYAVSALREAISGADWSLFTRDALALAAFAVAALALTAVTAIRARRWDPKRLEPAMGI